jgi:hypothetical protein
MVLRAITIVLVDEVVDEVVVVEHPQPVLLQLVLLQLEQSQLELLEEVVIEAEILP